MGEIEISQEYNDAILKVYSLFPANQNFISFKTLEIIDNNNKIKNKYILKSYNSLSGANNWELIVLLKAKYNIKDISNLWICAEQINEETRINFIVGEY